MNKTLRMLIGQRLVAPLFAYFLLPTYWEQLQHLYELGIIDIERN